MENSISNLFFANLSLFYLAFNVPLSNRKQKCTRTVKDKIVGTANAAVEKDISVQYVNYVCMGNACGIVIHWGRLIFHNTGTTSNPNIIYNIAGLFSALSLPLALNSF